MNADNILYRDPDIEITYLEHSPEDHSLALISGGSERLEYLLQRGVLKELAHTTRDGFQLKINTVNGDIHPDAQSRGLTYDSIHVAICQANSEEDRRYQNFASEMRTKANEMS